MAREESRGRRKTASNEQYWREIGGIVFATGAFVEEIQINGKWRWVVTEFEDDTFFEGVELDVNETADTRDDLVTVDPEEAEAGKEISEEKTEK